MIENPKRQMARGTSRDLRARARATGGLRFYRINPQLEERGKKLELEMRIFTKK